MYEWTPLPAGTWCVMKEASQIKGDVGHQDDSAENTEATRRIAKVHPYLTPSSEDVQREPTMPGKSP